VINSVPKNKKIVLFDGVCNLCNSAINYVIDRDKDDNFRFVALQSDLGEAIRLHLGLLKNDLDSIILYLPEQEVYYDKSTAALHIMKEFTGIWKCSTIFYIIPKPVRDLVYRFVAKNRYKWYGKKAQCRIPSPELKAKFL
jgi:predicted DCC family thiol-disulfide oxidoreductase YuxK